MRLTKFQLSNLLFFSLLFAPSAHAQVCRAADDSSYSMIAICTWLIIEKNLSEFATSPRHFRRRHADHPHAVAASRSGSRNSNPRPNTGLRGLASITAYRYNTYRDT
jgi:hypothetical protein